MLLDRAHRTASTEVGFQLAQTRKPIARNVVPKLQFVGFQEPGQNHLGYVELIYIYIYIYHSIELIKLHRMN